MGSALGTTGLTIFATLLIVVAAILIILADSKVKEITGYPEVDNINLAHKDLIYGQIFAWIAAALTFVLAIAYGLSIKFLLSPWPYLIIVLLIIGTLTASIIYVAMALNRINNLQDDKGASGYIYGIIILSGAALLILVISLIWGWTHTSTDPNKVPEDTSNKTYNNSQKYNSQKYNIDGYGYDYGVDADYQRGRSESQQNRYQPSQYCRQPYRPQRSVPQEPVTETFASPRSPRSRPPAEFPSV